MLEAWQVVIVVVVIAGFVAMAVSTFLPREG